MGDMQGRGKGRSAWLEKGFFMFCYLFFCGYTMYHYIVVPVWHGLVFLDIPTGNMLLTRVTASDRLALYGQVPLAGLPWVLECGLMYTC